MFNYQRVYVILRLTQLGDQSPDPGLFDADKGMAVGIIQYGYHRTTAELSSIWDSYGETFFARRGRVKTWLCYARFGMLGESQHSMLKLHLVKGCNTIIPNFLDLPE